MALFRLEAKVFSRESRGRSVIAAAAYRAGTKIKDELRDKLYDYSRKAKSVLETRVLAPEGAPDWAHNLTGLWNRVEAVEKRKDAQLAREFILALPRELDAKTRLETALDWVRRELVSKGMVAQVSAHEPKDGKNPHVHVLCTLRKVGPDGLSKKKPREWNDKALLVEQRKSWADAVNAALEKAGRPERVDHRSLKDRGIDKEPEPKIGVAATAMKRRGVEKDPKRFQLVRRVKLLNELRPFMRSLRERGEMPYWGIYPTWWRKSSRFVTAFRERAAEKIKHGWAKAVSEPKREGPDIER